MFKNVSIVTKVGIGFGVLLALLLGVSGVAFFRTKGESDSFGQYRELAGDSILAGRLLANTQHMRFYAKHYLKTGNEKDVKGYHKHKKMMLGFLEEVERNIQKPERIEHVNLFRDLIDGYIDGVAKIIILKSKRDISVYQGLDVNGPAMRNALTDIIESAYEDGDLTASYFAGRLQEHVLLGKLYAAKYLYTNQKDAIDRFENEMVTNIKPLIEILNKEPDNPERIKLLNLFLEKRDAYIDNFRKLVTIITERNDIVKNTLDRIGPAIVKAAEDVKLSVMKDQDALGPVIKARNEKTVYKIVFICLASFTIAVIFGILITRAIKIPIGLLTYFVSEFGKGNFDVRVELDTNDELGLLAGEFNNMAEKIAITTKKLDDLSRLSSFRVTLDERMRGELDERELGRNIISFLSTYLDAQIGSIYVIDEQGNDLKLCAGYAINRLENIKDKIKLGEGLAGQAASAKELIYVNNIPEDYARISSTIDDALPRNLVIMPFHMDDQLIGVLELGSFNEFREFEREFLSFVSNSIAIMFNTAKARTKQAFLLEET
ncbi:MAG: GAF domain-containing protein, partial [Candidatus Anammoxibacter sp.]